MIKIQPITIATLLNGNNIIVVFMLCSAKTKAPWILLSQRVFFSLTLAQDCEIHGHRLMGYLDSLSNLLCYVCEPKREFGIRSGERYTIGKSDGLHHPM